MKKLLILCVVWCLASVSSAADDENKAEDRIKAAATVLDEIEAAPDQGIPEEVLGSAQCVAVVPSMIKGGFIVGARYGRGVASCRTPKGWSGYSRALARFAPYQASDSASKTLESSSGRRPVGRPGGGPRPIRVAPRPPRTGASDGRLRP